MRFKRHDLSNFSDLGTVVIYPTRTFHYEITGEINEIILDFATSVTYLYSTDLNSEYIDFAKYDFKFNLPETDYWSSLVPNLFDYEDTKSKFTEDFDEISENLVPQLSDKTSEEEEKHFFGKLTHGVHTIYMIRLPREIETFLSLQHQMNVPRTIWKVEFYNSRITTNNTLEGRPFVDFDILPPEYAVEEPVLSVYFGPEYDTKLETSQKDIDTLLAKHPKEELEKEIKPFVIGKGALKAIGMLNGKNYLTKFEGTPTPTTELLLVYRLFFQLIAPKHPEFVSIKDNDQFWSKISVYFTENAHDELGKLVESEFKEVDLSNENICKIIDMCKPYQSILTPTYYSKNCPTTGLFVFLVKETLEYIGAINEKKTQPGRLYRNLEYRLNSLKEKKEKINAFIEKVKK